MLNMDLFEIFPQLSRADLPVLKGRTLRLITLSALVYDDEAFYFEVGAERFWGRLPGGRVSIGIGVPKVQPNPHTPPARVLARHLRQHWYCEVALSSSAAQPMYILDEDRHVSVLEAPGAHTPHFMIFTPPRLGGGDEVPDALVQAVYLMSLRRWRRSPRSVGLLRIARASLEKLLGSESWPLPVLLSQPWVELLTSTEFPEHAFVRPVLALRGLQHFLAAHALPVFLTNATAE